MKILVCHNKYRRQGGEDFSTSAEVDIFRVHGHEVIEYTRHNDEIMDRSIFGRARLYFETTWSQRSFSDIKALCMQHMPDVAHFHNTMPLISPSGYYACAESGIPVVQSLHNYRLICPGALLMRKGQPCEECAHGDLRPAVSHRCYHNSWIQTRALVRMLRRHRDMGTYTDLIHAYVASTDFSRNKFIRAGLPGKRIHVKPNFVEDPGVATQTGQGAIFVGRLSEEKGLRTLLSAWKQFSDMPLQIIGDGPLLPELKSFVQDHELINVHFHGHRSPSYCLTEIKKSKFLILPSTCYETFGRTIVEAFACGRPVIASNFGAMAELILPGRTGLLFQPGDHADLAGKVRWMAIHPEECFEMGQFARKEYEMKYTPESNYQMLAKIYEQAIRESGRRRT